MSYFHAAMVLAARDNNGEEGGWMQLLIFLVIAIFWAFGGIAKARANKITPKDFPEEGPEGETEEETVESEELQPAQRPRIQRPVPKKTIEHRQESITPRDIKTKKLKGQEPVPEVGLTDSGELSELSGIGENGPYRILSAKTESKETVKRLLRFEDSSDLRRAILHYEILGKPLSLRDPSEKKAVFD